MQISSSSSNGLPYPRSRDEIPSGKRAQAIKWTEQEWAEIAASIYLMDSTFLEEAGLAKIKARHVFEAQQSCLPRSRQRQLISIAQDFCTKREKILETMLQMRKGKSLSGITLRPAFVSRDTPATSSTNHPAPLADGSGTTNEIAGGSTGRDNPGTRNGLVMLSRPGFDSIIWAPEEWAIVARSLLDDNAAVRDGKGEEGIDAQSIYAAQQALPELRRRDVASIQARLVDDCARLRNILDVLRANTRPTTQEVEPRLPGTIFRADSSGNGFTRFTPKSLADAYPGHRIVSAEDTIQFSGVRRRGPSFKLPFPVETEAPPVRRPEVEQAIAELFGATEEAPITSTGTSATKHEAVPSMDAPSVVSSGSQKRSFIRWDENEWRQVAQTLLDRSGSKTDPETHGLITPLAVHAAQGCLAEDRRRTVASVYSGFASTREKLSEIVKVLAADRPADAANVSEAPLCNQVLPEAVASVLADSVQAEAVSVTTVRHTEPVPEARNADTASSHSLGCGPVDETHLGEAIQPVQNPTTMTEIARPFIRMVCEEFWDAIARHLLPPAAAYSEERK